MHESTNRSCAQTSENRASSDASQSEAITPIPFGNLSSRKLRHHGGLRQHVVKLPDVAGPRLLFHKCRCGGRQGFVGVAGFLLLELAIGLGQQPVGDVGDVTATLTQWRQGDREDGEAIEEVFSKRPGRDGFVEVAIGGGDHADVDGNLAMIADSADRSRTGAGSAGRLQHSQQLRLGLQIAFADFIEKQRATGGRLEGSLAVAIGWVLPELWAEISRNALASGSSRYKPGLAPCG